MTRHIHAWKGALLGAVAVLSVSVLSACSDDSADAVDASCTPDHEFATVEEGTLTVATYDFRPHMAVEGDKLSGVEGDLLAEFAARECLTITPQVAGGAGAAIPSVETDRADVAAGDWWRTKDREKIVSLSAPVYLDQGALVSTDGFQTIAELEGHKIGSVVGNLWNDQFADVFGDDFAVYQDPEAVFNDLAAGRIDAVIDSVGATTARFEAKPIEGAEIIPLAADPRIPVTANPGQLNWPTSKDNPELTAALDAQIEAMREDGTIAKMLEKYGLNASAADVGEPDLL
jgi:polar amino acid transport system substrate-binding protein